MAITESLSLVCLLTISLSTPIFAVEGGSCSWNSVLQLVTNPWAKIGKEEMEMAREINLKNYCESWRLNVEIHNIRGFDSVPDECASFVGKYMSSSQYRSDVLRAGDEALLFLTNSFALGGDGRDAWVFDVDDTLISTFPFYKQMQFGSDAANRTLLEEWMAKCTAPVIEDTLRLYRHIKERGLNIFLISWRPENLRAATVDNLIKAGYHGWSKLILRCDNDHPNPQKYMSEHRKKLMNQGYRLWGITAAQWSSLTGYPEAKRAFKLPNPMYYL